MQTLAVVVDSLTIAAVEHEVGALCRSALGPLLSDQQFGKARDVNEAYPNFEGLPWLHGINRALYDHRLHTHCVICSGRKAWRE